MADNFNQPVWNGDILKKDNAAVLSPKDFIFKYLRYLPWAIICASIACVVAYIRIRWTTPIYHVQSSMLIHDQEVTSGAAKDPEFQALFMPQGNSNLGNEVAILGSSPIIERVARSLNFQTRCYNNGKVRSTLMYPNSPIELEILHMADSNAGVAIQVTARPNETFFIEKDTTAIPFGRVFEYQGNRIELVRNPNVDLKTFPSQDFELSWSPARTVAGILMGGLKIAAPTDGTTILTLSFEGENVALGVNVLNKLMAVYDSLQIEDKNHISSNTLAFIDDQLRALRGQLAGVEGKTRGFMVDNNAFDINDQSKIYSSNIEDITKSEAQQRVKVAVLNMMTDYISDPTNREKLVPTVLGVDEPVVAGYIIDYNRLQLERESNLKTTRPDNPMIRDIDATLEKVRNSLLQALSNVKKSYEISINSMDEQLQGNKSNLNALPGKSMELMNIQRQEKILEDLYSFLLMKRLETAISSAATVSNSRPIEPASASYAPISPNSKNIYIFHILIGILIPVGIVALIEILKDKVSNRADVEKRTQAPILGEIGHSESDQPLVVLQNSRQFVAEQFRIIRSNLQYIVAKKERPVIMVTSSFSGEGKSFVSTNIGAVMALAGKRTVIMEYDIRKPKIVTGLELKRKMGITNYIIGKASFEELILPVQNVENLFVIPCGPIPPNPAELLLDPKLDDLMDEVKKHFEVVIMDTAPIGLVSDAVNLSKYADCALYIVRQGHTFRRQIGLIEDLYVEKKLPNISVILNDVKAEGGSYGGYSYYGGYGYYANQSSRSGYFDSNKKKWKGFAKLFRTNKKEK